MIKERKMVTCFLCACGMMALILDSKIAIAGASDGIEICLRTVIPSLFPFFVLSILLTSTVSGSNIAVFRPLEKLCGIPEGAGHMLLIGLLGGYPVGAQTVALAYNNKDLSKQEAHRLLGFCNNAGPAFIFGVAGSLFTSRTTVFLLWIIHVVSSLIVAAILPGKTIRKCTIREVQPISLSQAMSKSIRILAGVCGWIILFRIVIAFLNRWLLWMLPEEARLLTIGAMELANGCSFLMQTQSEAIRFRICSVILAFGGLCVGMQTATVTRRLGTGWYFPGKILQTVFSYLLSALVSTFLLEDAVLSVSIFATAVLIACAFIICKKTVAFFDKCVYNKRERKEPAYAVSKEN